MSAVNNRFGLVIVGDELLSGKRRDSHLDFAIGALQSRGGELAWARYIGDDIGTQVETYRQTRASGLRVFSFGGIGATPDDLTREAAAQAFERPLELHPQGMQLLQQRFGDDLTETRCQLVNFPRGATLIPNPINQVPGFSIEHHHFVPGFPKMAWPMLQWVLKEVYGLGESGPPAIEQCLRCEDTYESELIPLLRAVIEQHPTIKLSCLPSGEQNKQVELGVKGGADEVSIAYRMLCELLEQRKIRYQPLPHSA